MRQPPPLPQCAASPHGASLARMPAPPTPMFLLIASAAAHLTSLPPALTWPLPAASCRPISSLLSWLWPTAEVVATDRNTLYPEIQAEWDSGEAVPRAHRLLLLPSLPLRPQVSHALFPSAWPLHETTFLFLVSAVKPTSCVPAHAAQAGQQHGGDSGRSGRGPTRVRVGPGPPAARAAP